jgi:nitronate monooxygenase
LGIPEQHNKPIPVPDLVKAALEVILEENVPVWSIGLGNPSPEQVMLCHNKGIKVIAMIATVENAKEVSRSGVDVIIAQGSEAGGHRSTWLKRGSKEDACIGTMALVPQVVDAVKQPVVAAGSITDGRALAAALALGASGVLVGTRFLATKESGAPEFHKQAVLKTSSDSTTVTDKLSGSYARVIRNTITTEYEKVNGPVLPPWVHYLTAGDIYKAAREKNSADFYTLWAGQGVGHIKNIPGADEVVLSLIHEAKEVIKRLPKYTR